LASVGLLPCDQDQTWQQLRPCHTNRLSAAHGAGTVVNKRREFDDATANMSESDCWHHRLASMLRHRVSECDRNDPTPVAGQAMAHHRPDHAAALLSSVEPGWQAALVSNLS
jgi:hypothetical protein